MLELTTKGYSISHLWALVDGGIEIKESPNHDKCHADIWGDEMWDNEFRGYFDEKNGIVTCHSYNGVTKDFVNKIERKFDREGLVPIYFKGKIQGVNCPVREEVLEHC